MTVYSDEHAALEKTIKALAEAKVEIDRLMKTAFQADARPDVLEKVARARVLLADTSVAVGHAFSAMGVRPS